MSYGNVNDPEDEDEYRQIQKQCRVSIPSRFLDKVDLEVGDRSIVYCSEDSIVIMPKDRDVLDKVREKMGYEDG